MHRWNDKKVVVIGAARSGVAAAHLLLDVGALVTISDLRPETELPELAPVVERAVNSSQPPSSDLARRSQP